MTNQLYLLDEMKFMPQLSLATSPSEYFAWQDAMENLFAGCGFGSVDPQIAIACRHERKYIVLNNLDALHGKEMKMSPRKFVYIGTMQGTKRQQEVKEKEKENFGCSKQLSHDVDLRNRLLKNISSQSESNKIE